MTTYHQQQGALRIVRWERAYCGYGRSTREGYLLGFASADRDTFDDTVDAVKSLPARQRQWIPDERAWWIADDFVIQLAHEIPELRSYLDEHSTRFSRGYHSSSSAGAGDSKEGDSKEGNSKSQQQKQHNQSTQLSPVEAAYWVLWLRTGAPYPLVRVAYRTLSQMCHPDHGGNEDQQKQLNAAFALLECQQGAAAS